MALDDRAAIFWRLYERAEMSFLRRYLDPGRDVVDLGGSIGVGASYIARRLRPDRRLVVVEADPELAALLEENLRYNSQSGRYAIVNKAVYAGSQPVDHVSFRRARSSLSGRVTGASLPGTAGERLLETTNLSQLLAQYEIGEYTLVSDIEGAEIGLFLHDREAFVRCRRIIAELDGDVFEGKRYSLDDVVGLAQALGFIVRERYFGCLVLDNRRLLPASEAEGSAGGRGDPS